MSNDIRKYQYHVATGVRPQTREGIKLAHQDCLHECIGYFISTNIDIQSVTVALEPISSGSISNVVVTMIARKEKV